MNYWQLWRRKQENQNNSLGQMANWNAVHSDVHTRWVWCTRSISWSWSIQVLHLPSWFLIQFCEGETNWKEIFLLWIQLSPKSQIRSFPMKLIRMGGFPILANNKGRQLVKKFTAKEVELFPPWYRTKYFLFPTYWIFMVGRHCWHHHVLMVLKSSCLLYDDSTTIYCTVRIAMTILGCFWIFSQMNFLELS